MVLRGKLRGRVGRRRNFFKPGTGLLVPGFFFAVNSVFLKRFGAVSKKEITEKEKATSNRKRAEDGAAGPFVPVIVILI